MNLFCVKSLGIFVDSVLSCESDLRLCFQDTVEVRACSGARVTSSLLSLYSFLYIKAYITLYATNGCRWLSVVVGRCRGRCRSLSVVVISYI